MSGPLILAPSTALALPLTPTMPLVVIGGVVLGGAGLSKILSSVSEERKILVYKEFLKKRLGELTNQGMQPKDAMKLIGEEWQAKKKQQKNQGGPVSESKLKGASAQSFKGLRLEVPYLVEAQPDLAAAWDVAEGLLDFLMENASGMTGAEAFRRRAAAAYARAKGATSEGDQNEYDLGRSLGEALLLVMAHRGLTQLQWVQMLPPQLIEQESAKEEPGFIDRGLEMIGLKDEESASSKAMKQVLDKAVEATGQTVLDILK